MNGFTNMAMFLGRRLALTVVAACGFSNLISQNAFSQVLDSPEPTYRISDASGVPGAGTVPFRAEGASASPLPGYPASPARFHAPGPHGAKEPGVVASDGDPWDLARRLGIADTASYPIPESMRFGNLAVFNVTRTLETCTRPES